ncbi:MAG: DUF427 domain-containing protein [Rhodobacteraceae bacterium]|nr:DUF427 domain-containing protein [Paracoccaceae bacterium]
MPLPIENVQEYPRPPALEPVAETLRVILGGQVVAETTQGYRVLETHHAPSYYFPPMDVLAHLSSVPGQSFCEWKGVAVYWDVEIGSKIAPRAAWSYAKPTGRFTPIAGFLAFYAGAMDMCYVGAAKVIPQPGSFYGGWVTDNLRGHIKGAPGTEYW